MSGSPVYLPVLDPAQAAQCARIRAALPPGRPAIAFFCPTKSFRKQFGELPRLLEQAGHFVLYLYGEVHGDDWESHPTSFHVWGQMGPHLDGVDLFIVPTIMDCLPARSKKVLFYHISFAETGLSSASLAQPDPASGPYQALVDRYHHLCAFFPLYDYVVASSPNVMDEFRSILAFYGRAKAGAAPVRHQPDAEGLLRGLAGHRLAARQTLIPGGYPPMDVNIRHVAQTGSAPENVITYAPTPLAGKTEWRDYASAHVAGPDIVRALLDAFPDHQIVFKPHVDELPEIVQAVAQAASGSARFTLDRSGGDHRALYARTKVLVSDFSSTAYTFALSHLRPVVFYSRNESALPPEARDSAYGRHRADVGAVARSPGELVAAVRELLTHLDAFCGRIRAVRDQLLYNVGRSDEYLAAHIDDILRDHPVPEWEAYEGGPWAQFQTPWAVAEPEVLARPSSDAEVGAWFDLADSPAFRALLSRPGDAELFARDWQRCLRLLGPGHERAVSEHGLLWLARKLHALCRRRREEALGVRVNLNSPPHVGAYHPSRFPAEDKASGTGDYSAAQEADTSWRDLLLRQPAWLPGVARGVIHDLLKHPLAGAAGLDDLAVLLRWFGESAPLDRVRRLVLEAHLNLLRAHARSRPHSLAFFCPTRAFRGHFGDLPEQLERAGYAVLCLYGEVHEDDFERQSRAFYVGGDGPASQQIDFVDAIFTPVIMDCLPDRPIKVLVDHLSFAVFNPNQTGPDAAGSPARPLHTPHRFETDCRRRREEAHRLEPDCRRRREEAHRLEPDCRRRREEAQWSPTLSSTPPYVGAHSGPDGRGLPTSGHAQETNYREAVRRHTHAASLFRLYDYHVVPSVHVLATLRARAEFFGLASVTADGQVLPPPAPPHPDAAVLLGGLTGRRLARAQCLIPGGYPKMDASLRQATNLRAPEKVITYAPTPNKDDEDETGWKKFMSVNVAGPAIVARLAQDFPDYQIVYKPYAEERPDTVRAVTEAGRRFPNFTVDHCGSQYQALYARTALLVSDISSTAYTFAFTTLRPVLFFSPNEAELQAYARQLGGDPYCDSRMRVGAIATRIEELSEKVRGLLANAQAVRASIGRLRDDTMFQVGRSAAYLVEQMPFILEGRRHPDWCYYAEPAAANGHWPPYVPPALPASIPSATVAAAVPPLSKKALPESAPVQVAPDYRGYNLFGFRGGFYALPVGSDALVLAQLDRRQLQPLATAGRCFTGDLTAEVREQIDAYLDAGRTPGRPLSTLLV
jgi:CDP-glycerol glycerophosphotransferase (TagB/SpsB family)